MDKKVDLIKVAGVAGTLLSVGATLLSSWHNEKNTEQLIEKKVQEALKNMNK